MAVPVCVPQEHSSWFVELPHDDLPGSTPKWEKIASAMKVNINGDSITVTLRASHAGRPVVADAIRIIRTQAELPTTTYAYDYHNRLIQVETPQKMLPPNTAQKNTVKFEYDVLDRRVTKEQLHNDVSQWKEYYVLDGAHVAVADQAMSDGTHRTHHYLWDAGIDQLVAFDQWHPSPGLTKTAWALTDRQGTVSDLISRDGTNPSQLLATRTFDAYGLPGKMRWTPHGPFASLDFGPQFLYAGQQFDPDTGLQYSRARYYDPFAVQFVSQDPIGLLSGETNPYRRAGNSPANATDPNGLANLWNIYTWGIDDSHQSWADFFNPLAESNPYWETRAAFDAGLRTGLKANGNAIIDTGVSMATLGTYTGKDFGWNFKVTAADMANGYGTSYMFARGSWELLAGLGVGKLAQAPGYLGKGAFAVDFAGNATGVVRGVANGDMTQVFFAGMGLSGNLGAIRRASSGTRAADDVAHSIRRTETSQFEELSRTQLSQFGEAIAKNDRTARLYRELADLGIDVKLNYGAIVRTEAGRVIKGDFTSFVKPGAITVHARAHNSLGDLVETFAHEARHAIDSSHGLRNSTRMSEYRAAVEEFLVMNRRAPSRPEMGELARRVNEYYSHLPADSRFLRIAGY